MVHYIGAAFIIESVACPGNARKPSAKFRLGVDVSHHNEEPDWDAFKSSGASFVFIKASEGVGTRDKKALKMQQKPKQKGLRIGYYHFFADLIQKVAALLLNDATAEANEVLQTMTGLSKARSPTGA